MREIRAYGSVGVSVGNHRHYPADRRSESTPPLHHSLTPRFGSISYLPSPHYSTITGEW